MRNRLAIKYDKVDVKKKLLHETWRFLALTKAAKADAADIYIASTQCVLCNLIGPG